MENIMLDTPKRNIKLVDFGLSNTFTKDELMKTHCGSPEYAAPELFLAGGKYGMEIDIWSLGIVMYAMLVGKLPFTTPYTDQYRRQKLVQQMEKGLVEVHKLEMSHLTEDCQDLLYKVIEPSPSFRLPLLDMEIHSWITDNAKKPFFPFQSFPRDKPMKMQDSMSSLEEDETLEELATALSMKKDLLEHKVAENKSDELSAMFNMILDRKRQLQGIFDVDHTVKGADKKETKGKRSKSAHAKFEKGEDKKQLSKGPPALVLPSDDTTADSAHYTGNEQDHDSKFSTFDFLALCSTPTWLGPERRKSRRRSRSPMPSPHIQQHGSQGLSVRNQMKRDFMERQALEMEREMLREERAAAAGLLSPDQQQNHNHNDHHNPVNTSLSVPGNDSTSSHQLAIRRSSSFKLSRRRARSCGPSHRPKGSYQRSCSVDHHTADLGEVPNFFNNLSSAKEGQSAPAITGDVLLRGNIKTASPKVRRGSISGPSNVIETRKPSVDLMDITNKNFLGVPNFDMHVNNPPSLLSGEPQKSHLEIPDEHFDDRSHLQIPNVDMGSNPVLCVPNVPNAHNSLVQTEDRLALTNGSKLQSITRPGKLTLKECYSPPKEEKNNSSSFLLPIIKPIVSGVNGPLASVEVHHYAGSSNPSSFTNLLNPSPLVIPKTGESLEVPYADVETLTDSKSSGSGLEICDKLAHGDSSFENLLNNWDRKKIEKTPQMLLETAASSSTSHIKPPSAEKSSHLKMSCRLEEGAVAMQIEDKPSVLCYSSEDRILLGAEGICTHCNVPSKDGLIDLHDHFHGLIISSECLEENEDRVDSMTELISDSFKEEVLANTKLSNNMPVCLGATQKVNRQNSLPTPDDDFVQSKVSSRKGSVTSFSRSSGSGRRSGNGKVKSPITPTWLNLKTPLARIESFHSDDFECFANSDNDEQGSASPMSVTTPTVPCFAYKLHVMKKKQTKLKDSGSSKNRRCGSIQNNDYTSSKLSRNAVDKKKTPGVYSDIRLEAAVNEPLLSSGSDTEHHEDGQDRIGTPGKSKIHPMEIDDRDAELLSKSDTKCLPYHNAITRQPNQIKNSIKLPKIIQEDEQGAKKKAFVKNLAWRKSFTQFLKRKRYHSPVATSAPQQYQQQMHQQQQSSLGNNNNNDLAHRDPLPESRNGLSALGQQQNKVMEISAGTEDLLVTSLEVDSIKVVPTTVSSVPVENCITELSESQTSPKLHCSSSPTQAFDFNLATDSPRMKSSCLISWGTCRDCGKGDISSEEDVECFTTVDMAAVGQNLKPIGENNVQENINFSQTYQLSPT